MWENGVNGLHGRRVHVPAEEVSQPRRAIADHIAPGSVMFILYVTTLIIICNRVTPFHYFRCVIVYSYVLKFSKEKHSACDSLVLIAQR